jgi:hypothetical protein
MVLKNWSKLSSSAADIVEILTSRFYEGNSIGDVMVIECVLREFIQNK